MNDFIREEISKSNSENWHFQPNYFNVHKEVEKINPLLWHFIECATSSTQERKGTPSREENTFIKKCRRLFLVSILAFCTNTQHTTLMHTLLAETIEMCGGSRKLVKIFNRLGVTCSSAVSAQRDSTVWIICLATYLQQLVWITLISYKVMQLYIFIAGHRLHKGIRPLCKYPTKKWSIFKQQLYIKITTQSLLSSKLAHARTLYKS